MARVEKLRELMKENNLQGLLVVSPCNLCCLTNFTGAIGLAMITLDKAFFIVDFCYTKQATEQATGLTTVKNIEHVFDGVADLAERLQLDNLAFEETQVSLADYNLSEEILPCELVPVTGLIEELREVKDGEEVAVIEKACAIVDQEFAFALEMIKPGMTEIEVINQLDFFMYSKGTNSAFFKTIVVGSLRSVMSYGVTNHKVVEKGELITLDFGCCYEGYASDMAYTFTVGDVQPRLEEVYDIVSEAQLEVLTEAKPGLTGIQLDTTARDHITSCGYGDAFDYSIGHGIGLEIREGPNASSRVDKQFVPGNVTTDEPEIYLPGISGVCVEDDLLITAEGNRVLTHAPGELIIL